jgi:hypothetical protein
MPSDFYLELAGEQMDLEEAARSFQDFDPIVRRDGDAWKLISKRFSGIADSTAISQVADPLVRQINQALRCIHPNHRDISVASISRMDDSGKMQRHIIVKPETLSLRTRVHGVAAIVGHPPEKPRPSPAQRLVMLSSVDPQVAEVMELWNQSPRRGDVLYKIYEVIRAAHGSDQAIADAGIAEMDELKRFTGSVNRPDVLGRFARHARMTGAPPKKQMTQQEAVKFARKLIDSWTRLRYDEALRRGMLTE